MNRRHYLAGTWVLFSGAVVGAVVWPVPQTDAIALPDDDDFTYRGRNVHITPHGRDVHVLVNGSKAVHVHRGGPHGGYLTHVLPFTEFTSARQLVQAVINAEDSGLLIL